jgi:hypothetical protein
LACMTLPVTLFVLRNKARSAPILHVNTVPGSTMG